LQGNKVQKDELPLSFWKLSTSYKSFFSACNRQTIFMSMIKNSSGAATAIAFPFVMLGLCSNAQGASLSPQSSDPVLLWTDATLQAISRSKFGPTVSSRAIGMTMTSLYDAWAAYDPVAIGTQMGDTLQVADGAINDSNKQIAMSYAAYRTLSDLFPTQQSLFDGVMLGLGYDTSLMNTLVDPSALTVAGLTDKESAIAIGNFTAQQLLAYRHSDGANQLAGYTSERYPTVNTWNALSNPQHWQPLSLDGGVTVQKFLTPHWNQVAPFSLSSADQFLPPPPESLLTEANTLNPDYVAQALLLLEYSAELTDSHKVIAEYWADGPGTVLPPGHWLTFGQAVSQRDQLSLDDNVKLFFSLGNAVFDAGIAAWDAKVHYDYARPITAVRYLAENNLLPSDHPYVRINDAGKTEVFAWAGPNLGSQWILGSEWMPYQSRTFVTPPFAEYVSGHSTFSAASAEVLKSFTGSDRFDLCHTQAPYSSAYESLTPSQPVELCWDTFSEAADQAGLSRLYGGIHFQDGDVNGRALGRSVGQSVWQRSQFYISGGQRGGQTGGSPQSVPEPGTWAGIAAVGFWQLLNSRLNLRRKEGAASWGKGFALKG
jgi:hypothetical protein